MIVREGLGCADCGMHGITPGQGVSVAGGTIASVAPLTGPAAPIVAAVGGIVAAVGQIMNMLGVGTGCGEPCIAATNVVNQAAPVLQQNLDGYENGIIDQTTAISNYNQVWNSIVQACSRIPGDPGINCVGDRQQGACKWNQTGQPQYPGQPAYGECWNWYEAYYKPLLLPAVNAPTNTTNTSSLVSDVSNMFGGVDPMWLLAGGAVVVGLSMAE